MEDKGNHSEFSQTFESADMFPEEFISTPSGSSNSFEEDEEMKTAGVSEKKSFRSSQRRVGTVTMGLSLIAGGLIFFLYNLFPDVVDMAQCFRFTPLILVSLGIEILLFFFFQKEERVKYDFLSGLYCFLMLNVGMFMTAIPVVNRLAERLCNR